MSLSSLCWTVVLWKAKKRENYGVDLNLQE